MAVMTSDTDPVALLERALDQTAGLIAAIEPSQAGLATPCAGWDVRALVSHLAGQDLRNFLVAVRGEAADWQAPAEDIGDDWAAAFRDRAAPLRVAWRAADLDRPVSRPGGEAPLRARADQQITELAAHDWDLARATGQQLGGLVPAGSRLGAGYPIALRSSARAVARLGPYQVSRRPGTRTTRWAGNSSGPSSGVNREGSSVSSTRSGAAARICSASTCGSRSGPAPNTLSRPSRASTSPVNVSAPTTIHGSRQIGTATRRAGLG